MKRISHSVVFCALSLLLMCSHAFAQLGKEEKTLESQIALFHYNLLTLTKWSEGQIKDDFVFCVEPRHFLQTEFAKLLPKKSLFNKEIKLEILDYKNEDALFSCNAIALNGKESFNKKIIELVSDKEILTISAEDDVTKYGGISFIPQDGKVSLPKISYKSLKKSGLSMNAWFLNSSIEKWKNFQ